MGLVIVESPTKANTIKKIMGSDIDVLATMGHVIDLPEKSLGIDIKKDFRPNYVVMNKRRKVINNIKLSSIKADRIFIATDPDREGEAIGWLVMNFLEKKGIPAERFARVTFHEITPKAIKKAFEEPHGFNEGLIDAQKARRVLDRIVGYYLSPLLWKKVGKGLSAGRVQSIALRLIVDRERAIASFVPEEYWDITADFSLEGNVVIKGAVLDKVDGKKPDLKSEAEAAGIAQEAAQKAYTVSAIDEKNIEKKPPAPFITSTLQQYAYSKLGFSAAKTMQIAQQLYEGIEMGEKGAQGLITYMRTDSVNVSKDAIEAARGVIQSQYPECLPEKPNIYRSKKSAQEAHEAIRPASIEITPDDARPYLTEDQYKLYLVIWQRFLASQMKPAVYLQRVIQFEGGRFLFKKGARRLIFPGFLSVYEDTDKDEEQSNNIEECFNAREGVPAKILNVVPNQHFTRPPSRYNDATLVRELEEKGIGRPSTYAPTIMTIIRRGYVVREKGSLRPSELGEKVCDTLVKYFPNIMDYGFTAELEERLDSIESNQTTSVAVLQAFYPKFNEEVEFAMQDIKKEAVATEEVCEKCGAQMVIKWGRNGRFLSCSNFPKCKNAKPISTGKKCPLCGGDIIERVSTKGKYRKRFYGCSNYPNCRFISNSLSDIKGPDEAKDSEG